MATGEVDTNTMQSRLPNAHHHSSNTSPTAEDDDGSLSSSVSYDDAHDGGGVAGFGRRSSHGNEHSSGGSDNDSATGSTSSNHTGSDKNFRRSEDEIANHREAKVVLLSKVCVLSVLFVATATAAFLTYYFARESEHSDFVLQYNDYAREIEDVTKHNLKTALDLIAGFGSVVTSYALVDHSSTDDDFSFVTLPHFEVRGEGFRKVSGARLLAYAPLVSHDHLSEWSNYSTSHQQWIAESFELGDHAWIGTNAQPKPIHETIFEKAEDGTFIPPAEQDEYSPIWQQTPPPFKESFINFNLLSDPLIADVVAAASIARRPVLSQVTDPTNVFGPEALGRKDGEELHPNSILIEPVFNGFNDQEDPIVGYLVAVIPWEQYFQNVLHEAANAIIAVLGSSCGDRFSFRIDGPVVTYLGEGDRHSSKYNSEKHTISFSDEELLGTKDTLISGDNCRYEMLLFPTEELEETYYTSGPGLFTAAVVIVFAFTTMVFLGYDFLVQRRQRKVENDAVKSNAIVSSLFPADIRDRLFQNNAQAASSNKRKKNGMMGGMESSNAKFRLKNMLEDESKASNNDVDEKLALSPDVALYETKPIADLFPNTTVLFADISGFTAWSSVREPTQVFTLLETVYRAFDMIAKKRRVFKVETVGDCYVAVTGLPEPRKDHAVMMCRFARDCKRKMNELSKLLEVSLGPDTGDLAMRFGLHSGPVTAGVLRGDKSRFQLFGDTVNTAARVEASGIRNRIHLSEETATLLVDAGKSSWVVPREDTVVAKGKGKMKTYWLQTRDSDTISRASTTPDEEDAEVENLSDQQELALAAVPAEFDQKVPEHLVLSPKLLRLVSWNVDVLSKLLRQVVSKRTTKSIDRHNLDAIDRMEKAILNAQNPLDEVVEIVNLPEYSETGSSSSRHKASLQPLPKVVVEQLQDYVKTIAQLYRENSFHNFEHASHVTMSVSKLLSRIVAPDINETGEDLMQSLHDHTYGITSDPLTQFAVVLSGLIHDIDHVGLPNYLLVGENTNLANHYENKSVAEQNSIDIAWQILMQPRFSALRHCIYKDTQELARFRQLVVNTVLATDIFDRELGALRRNRWDKAFSSKLDSGMSIDRNRKATIVIEHLIQASDVSHCMQHWQVYQKWNERLFDEMMVAYISGRSEKNPAEGWFEGEIGFFDHYVIPLAGKLRECGVFGVSSDEYLQYALTNREEWQSKGQGIVQRMVAKYEEQNGNS
eukprot:CAMPEP_0119547406 /NCGR_PEP_ID=MMETSP1352-20130426/1528_1 /TAXON_ID=265584 /ORGANISM="Stauroneis constricta, Strain CCMP1120" /LENGTH=1220 /DNA_ID=CAMNT_0007592327 /DNA_START=199 /DNA_END=3861 /DNA_ORIENTATION=+